MTQLSDSCGSKLIVQHMRIEIYQHCCLAYILCLCCLRNNNNMRRRRQHIPLYYTHVKKIFWMGFEGEIRRSIQPKAMNSAIKFYSGCCQANSFGPTVLKPNPGLGGHSFFENAHQTDIQHSSLSTSPKKIEEKDLCSLLRSLKQARCSMLKGR